MLISRLWHPVTSLGHGIRAGIWTQGCTIRCPGCMARDTWQRRADTEVDLADIAQWLRLIPGRIDGVTISGGEPTEQDGLGELISIVRSVAHERGERWDVLVFSGRETSALRAEFPCLFEAADAVVTGPFVREMAGGAALRGSRNQEIVLCSELGRERYGHLVDGEPAQSLDFAVDGDGVWLVGIPQPGDLERFESELAARGVRAGRSSWARGGGL